MPRPHLLLGFDKCSFEDINRIVSDPSWVHKKGKVPKSKRVTGSWLIQFRGDPHINHAYDREGSKATYDWDSAETYNLYLCAEAIYFGNMFSFLLKD